MSYNLSVITNPNDEYTLADVVAQAERVYQDLRQGIFTLTVDTPTTQENQRYILQGAELRN